MTDFSIDIVSSDKAQDKLMHNHVAVKACIFKGDRMLVLYKPDDARRRSAAPQYEEDLPGGCIEVGESWEEALAREVWEEVHLGIKIGEPLSAWSILGSGRHILGLDFVCHWVAGEVELSWEHERYEWLTLEDLRAKGWERQAVYEEAFRIAADPLSACPSGIRA